MTLDLISKKCGLSRSSLQARDDGFVFNPPRDAKYDAVDCGLAEIKKMPDFPANMGFVGNERYEPEAK